jgi:Family of unknown function (DUF5908)
MPIEIRELVIRATVEPRRDDAPGGGQPGPEGEDRARLIQQCVDEVLKALKRQRVR